MYLGTQNKLDISTLNFHMTNTDVFTPSKYLSNSSLLGSQSGYATDLMIASALSWARA